MSTSLGDVWVELRIDTKKAEQELDEMDRKAKASEKRRQQKGKVAEGATSDGSGFDRDVDVKLDPPDRSRKQRRSDKQLHRRLGVPRPPRKRTPVTRGVSRRITAAATRVAGGRVPVVSGLAARGGMAGAGGVAKAAGIAAAIYLGARAAAHTAPLAGEFLEGATEGAFPDALTFQAKKARNAFNRFEALLKSLYTGARRTLEFQGISGRISGEIPNFGSYYKTFQRIEEETDALNTRFEEFKRDKILGAWGTLSRKVFGKDISN